MNRWILVVCLGLTVFAIVHWRKTGSKTAGTTRADEARKVLLIVGFNSDNIVSYDLDTNVTREVIRFDEFTKPRGIGQTSNGDLYVATRQGKKNVIRIGLTGEGVEFTDFTDPIGRYGPAQVHVDVEDRVYVAGDTTHAVSRYLPDGTLDQLFQGKSIGGNVCGFAVGDDAVFTAHLFRGAIGRHGHDEEGPPARFQMDPEVMKNTYSALVAPNGNLLVGGGRGCAKVLELNPETGEVLGVFADLAEQGLGGVSAMVHVAGLQAYFFAAPGGLLEYTSEGVFVGRHEIGFIDRVAAIGLARNSQALDRMAAIVSAKGTVGG